jgi:hypothetical protein
MTGGITREKACPSSSLAQRTPRVFVVLTLLQTAVKIWIPSSAEKKKL